MAELVTADVREGVALVTLNRAEKRNALSLELREEFASALAALGGDPDVRCLVLTGAGSAFSAGMDVTEFGGNRAHKERIVSLSIAAFRALGGFPKPAVAAVNGPAIAGGFALALLCDIRVSSETATFGFPELPRGIPPSYASARAALPAPLARELCLTGRLLDAGEALRLGVVSEVCGDALERSMEVATRIAGMPPFASEQTKRRILLEREHLYGPLFEDEERVLRESLLGGD